MAISPSRTTAADSGVTILGTLSRGLHILDRRTPVTAIRHRALDRPARVPVGVRAVSVSMA